jgi:hypothetical protein
MTTADPFVEILAARGWLPRPPTRAATSRVAYPRNDGSELLLERRDDNLWLWVIERDDKRCFEIDPSGAFDVLLDKVVAIQDELTVDTYLAHYLDLSALGEISIVAWEQYEPAYR